MKLLFVCPVRLKVCVLIFAKDAELNVRSVGVYIHLPLICSLCIDIADTLV